MVSGWTSGEIESFVICQHLISIFKPHWMRTISVSVCLSHIFAVERLLHRMRYCLGGPKECKTVVPISPQILCSLCQITLATCFIIKLEFVNCTTDATRIVESLLDYRTYTLGFTFWQLDMPNCFAYLELGWKPSLFHAAYEMHPVCVWFSNDTMYKFILIGFCCRSVSFSLMTHTEGFIHWHYVARFLSSCFRIFVIRTLKVLFVYSSFYVCIKSHMWSAKQQLHHQQSSWDKPPFNFIRGQASTVWDIVCFSPQGHKSVAAWFHFFLQVPQWPCAVWKQLSRDHCCHGSLKPGCWIVGSTVEKLTTWANFQFSFHWLLMSTCTTKASCMRDRHDDIRMNWPIVMCYNLRHEIICGSLSTESRKFSVGENW